MKRAIVIGVMGAGQGAQAEDIQNANALGRFIGENGWVLLTGGRSCGVMEAANQGASQMGGLTLGILPGDSCRNASSAVALAIPTGLGNARNAINILASDIVVVCGERLGAGTLSETALTMKSQKPLIVITRHPETVAFLRGFGYGQLFLTESVKKAFEAISRKVAQLNPANRLNISLAEKT